MTKIEMGKKYYILLGIFFLVLLALGLWNNEYLAVYNKAIVI